MLVLGRRAHRDGAVVAVVLAVLRLLGVVVVVVAVVVLRASWGKIDKKNKKLLVNYLNTVMPIIGP